MGWNRLWARKPAGDAAERGAPATNEARDRTRRELVAMAVRDTLRKHGLAAASFGLEVARAPGRAGSLQLQLVVTRWDPQLLSWTLALQKAILARLLRLDPLAGDWMGGVVWKFAPADEGQWPSLPPVEPLAVPRTGSAAKADRALLESLLDANDSAFGRRASNALEFSPTLPMQVR